MNIGRTVRVFRAEPVLHPVPHEPATVDRAGGPGVAAEPEPVPAGVRPGPAAAPPARHGG